MTGAQLIDPPVFNTANAQGHAYDLPDDSYREWQGCEAWAYQPTARQRPVIEAVRTVCAEGLFYTNDVRSRCIEILQPSAEQLGVLADKVHGGEFGMDCYYARRYLDAQATFQKVQETFEQLKPTVGMQLGTVVFSDYKRTTGVKIVSVDGYSIAFTGRRGRYTVTGNVNTLVLSDAIDRAAERGLRKDTYRSLIGADLRKRLTRSQRSLLCLGSEDDQFFDTKQREPNSL